MHSLIADVDASHGMTAPRHPPAHLAAAVAAPRAIDELEPGIWRAGRADAAIAQYDTIGGAYDLVGGLDAYHRVFWGVRARPYRTFADAAVAACGAGTLLDAACGSMLFTVQAHRTNTRGTAIGADASVRMLRLARERLGPAADSGGMALLQADVLAGPFRSAAFEVVLCMHVAHVLEDVSALLDETRRILKPGGKLFLTSIVAVGSWRDSYLRMLCHRGIMAVPRRAEDIVAAVRTRFGTEPAAHTSGSMVFLQVTKR